MCRRVGGWGQGEAKVGGQDKAFGTPQGASGQPEGVGKQSGAPVPMGRDGQNLGLGRNGVIVEIKRWKIEDPC